MPAPPLSSLATWLPISRLFRSLRRGGPDRQVSLDEEYLVAAEPPRDLVALDDARAALSELDARKGRVVELRFFGGLSVKETADVLEVSPQTVMRDWALAKVWLVREMKRGCERGPSTGMIAFMSL